MTILKNTVSIFALGGINEIGKNMYVLQYEEDLFVIDCGSMFPDENLLGIDLIIQDISYLKQNQDKIRALLITHGHEDHIGGIAYFLKQLNIPVYATALTAGLINSKLKEHGLLRSTDMTIVHAESKLVFGNVEVTFFKTNHSIPDCVGIVFHTPVGTVVHTGDFKFDLTPVNNDVPDIHKMAQIGERGVLALLSESTNAERPGFNPSEITVGGHIEEEFRKARNKVFISTFASNVHRVQQVIDAAQKTGRKLALLGRSMNNVVNVASELGHLNIPDGMLIEPYETGKLSPEKVAILCTGSQGEPMAALSRLSSSNFRQVKVLPDDTVIFASSPIPGNEKNVSRIIDNLYQLKANVIYGSGSATGMHVSGHANQEELKLMLTLMKPKYFIPIHGEHRMLYKHKQLAESVGVESENIFIISNGDVVDIDADQAVQTRKVHAGRVFVDGLGVGDVGNVVLRDRRVLSEEGMLVILITVSKTDGQLVSEPDTISRGFVYQRDAQELIKEVNDAVTTTVNNLLDTNGSKRNVIRQNVKSSVEKLLFERTKRRPMILPFVIEM
ncbi:MULTISPECIES: ribonuclease J [unclassified Sporosarcina]|uniref:ribonuclease J n=1 Tax=unclassified Sporosarcina TaxID=2647733 RepID=UPI00203A3F61|nr:MULTISPECIES: ribonuclease J [unclassified Sporosarcina]GKV67275.1 ribonuclease J [Sporosarcina sp. NCCP-2331]GLB57628.1 ribonuclease J [Sporosarcina sp. NCCP-2378]